MRRLVIGLLMGVGFNVAAQERLPPGVRGPESTMATRSVSKYLQLERDLQDAIRDKNTDAVKRTLAAEFEVRSSDKADATSMDAWSLAETRSKTTNVGVRDMTVRDFDDIAAVSFFLDRKHTVKGRPVTSTSYVVDIWRQSTSQLLVRYVTKPVKPVPAPIRPSGRE